MARVGKYLLYEVIGEGAFGKVKLGVHEDTGDQVAVKIMDKSHLQRHEMSFNVRREIAIMKALSHKNIVNMRQVLSSATKLYIVMDLVTGGELFTKILNEGSVEETLARRFFQQLVDGVDYCHRSGVCHRDLKPENLLIDEYSGDLKITDFGLSALLRGTTDDDDSFNDILLHTQCGSVNYVAPEVLTASKKGYQGDKVDSWASGIILYALLAGYLPFFADDTKTLYHMIQNDPVTFPDDFPHGARDLVRKLLDKNPDTRYSMADCRTHPWFQIDYKTDETLGQEVSQVAKTAGTLIRPPRRRPPDSPVDTGAPRMAPVPRAVPIPATPPAPPASPLRSYASSNPISTLVGNTAASKESDGSMRTVSRKAPLPTVLVAMPNGPGSVANSTGRPTSVSQSADATIPAPPPKPASVPQSSTTSEPSVPKAPAVGPQPPAVRAVVHQPGPVSSSSARRDGESTRRPPSRPTPPLKVADTKTDSPPSIIPKTNEELQAAQRKIQLESPVSSSDFARRMELAVYHYRRLFQVHKSGRLLYSQSFRDSNSAVGQGNPLLRRTNAVTAAWYVRLSQLLESGLGDVGLQTVTESELSAFEGVIRFWAKRAQSPGAERLERWWLDSSPIDQADAINLQNWIGVLQPRPEESGPLEEVDGELKRERSGPDSSVEGVKPSQEPVSSFDRYSQSSSDAKPSKQRSYHIEASPRSRQLSMNSDAEQRPGSSVAFRADSYNSAAVRSPAPEPLRDSPPTFIASRAVSDVTGGRRAVRDRPKRPFGVPKAPSRRQTDSRGAYSKTTGETPTFDLAERAVSDVSGRATGRNGIASTRRRNPVGNSVGDVPQLRQKQSFVSFLKRRPSAAVSFESRLTPEQSLNELGRIMDRDGCSVLTKRGETKMKIEVPSDSGASPLLLSFTAAKNELGTTVTMKRAKSDRSNVRGVQVQHVLESTYKKFIAQTQTRL